MSEVILRAMHEGDQALLSGALYFAHTAVNGVQASTDVENIAAQRALKRAGLSRGGILRASQWRRGGYHDMCIYAILRADQSA